MSNEHLSTQYEFLEKLERFVKAYISRERAAYRRCTREIIAEKIGPYDRVTFHRWMTGVNRMPPEALERLCKLMDLADKDRKDLLVLAGYADRFAATPITNDPGFVPQPKLGNAPPLPGLMLGRDKDVSAIKTRLGLTGKVGGALQVLTAMRGWPGVGKTTLAAALAHDPDIAVGFPDGVLWASLGKQPNLIRELAAWGRLLGVPDLHQVSTVEEMSAALRGLLRTQQRLLIVDDVWQAEHIAPFNVGGRGCTLLVTTRLPEVASKIAPTPEDVYILKVLDDANALELLRTLAPTVVAANKDTSLELVQDLEGLPLAIQVAGRLLQTEAEYGFGVTELLKEIREGAALIKAQAPANLAEVANETTPTVAALLKKSTDLLDAHTLDCFAALAPFAPKPATFDAGAMAAMWEVDNPKPTIRTLIDRGLLERYGEERYWMHAILVAHARSFLEDD
ncbi:MAG TPA: NB-ARC domain-containing protein [Roseiflexaceae bacterium]|nr:NB-ARC domain-containing protein [Roseiflexaceae bacterium]